MSSVRKNTHKHRHTHNGYVQNQTSDQSDESNLIKIVHIQISEKHFTFRITSRSPWRHLRKIWLRGEILASYAHDVVG